jgi:carbon-monoxide dehydrogenase medium subunit
MKPARFDYQRAGTPEAAAAMLLAHGSEARVLAGGQTLGPMLNMRLAMPGTLIDIGGIASLKRIEQRSDWLSIGACVTHAMLEDRIDRSPLGGLLSHVASTIAFRAIRNRGTVGGSLAHADPAADWPSVMTLLDARLVIVGTSDTHRIRMTEFMHGAFTTALAAGELLAAIEVPGLSPEARWGYFKVCRKTGEFPEAIGAALFDRSRSRYRVVAGALDGAPVLLTALAEQVSRNGAPAASLANVTDAVAEVAPGLDAVDLQLHAVAVRRAILQAVSS